MAIIWRCYLDAVLLDNEPVNMAEIELSVIRDVEMHGIGAEAATSPLEFVGNGATYLEGVKDTLGLKANVVFKAQRSCGPNEDFETVVEGKLNFSDYKQKCGNVCSVTMPMETVTCETIMKNRYDQAVDMDKNTASDGLTALDTYEDMNFPIKLATRVLPYKTEGSVPADEPLFVIGPTALGTQVWIVRPDYGNVVAANFNQTELTGSVLEAFFNSGVVSPVVLWDERLVNFPSPVTVTGRLKGAVAITPGNFSGSVGYLVVVRGEMAADNWNFGQFGPPDPRYIPISILTLWDLGDPRTSVSFDMTYSYSWSPTDNGADGIYAFLTVGGGTGATYFIKWDPETTFKAESIKAVPSSSANAYMVHETLSRAVENITNNCAKVKSSYYGRTDSQPFSFDSDGCGSLRMLTSGLKIRNAPDAKFSPSLQDLVKGLQCIDNIGIGVELNTELGGGYLLRIEALDFFYQDVEIMRCPFIPEATYDLEPSRFYSKINIGYKKWETQANFGLDEYNSTREYRTSLTSVSNILDKTSDLIAGGYAIEITREQQFADTNSADTRYDDDTFIICLKRNGIYGYAYGGLLVEQGGIDFATNIFSPETDYNYRITPARNLMRWYRSIMASYPNMTDAENRVYFSAGTGNIKASGQLQDSYLNDCVLESVPISESQDIVATQFKDLKKATPLWRNETFTFNYPMSLSDYNKIKANPYGYISFQCGKGTWDQGFIKELKYKPVAGQSTIILRRRWL